MRKLRTLLSVTGTVMFLLSAAVRAGQSAPATEGVPQQYHTIAPPPPVLFPETVGLTQLDVDSDDEAPLWEHPKFLQNLEDEESPPASLYQISFVPRFYVGNVKGYTQVTKGSAVHTTSPERPQLQELGISTALIPDLELRVSRGPHEVYVGAQFVRMDGIEKIKKRFISEGQTFTSKTRVKTNLGLDWYRLGYRYNIPLFVHEDGIPRLTITPQADVVYWNLNYRLKHTVPTGSTTATAQTVSRADAKGSFRLGAGAEWRPYGGPLSIDAVLLASPPITGMVFVASEELDVKYRLLDTPHFGMTASVGLAFEQMNFRDHGTVANHIHVEFGPLFVTGLEMRF